MLRGLFATAAACAAIVSLVFLAADPIARTSFPLDDAWIHHVYARGLLVDHAPTYNPGRAEAGFSSPLWLIALLPVQAVARASPVLPTKLVSLAFAVVAAAGIGRLSGLLGASRLATHVATAWASLGALFAFSAVSGMEPTMTAALLAWAFVALAEERICTAAVLLGLASIARPESWIVVALVTACVARRGVRRAALLAAPTLALIGLWVAYNLRVTGRPLPNTFYVKSSAVPVAENVAWFVDVVVTAGGVPLAVVEAALIALGIAHSVRGQRRELSLTLAISIVASTFAVLLTHQLGRHVLFYAQRYVVPFTTLSVAFLGVGVDRVADFLRARAPRLLRIGAISGALAGALLLSVPLALASSSHAAHCADIERLHVVPARRIDELAPEGVAVAVEGAGAARYFAHRRIIDALGLNFHPVAGRARDPFRAACTVLLEGPRLLVVPESWLAALEGGYELNTLERYGSAQWSVDGGRSRRIVAIVRAKPRPSAVAACQGVVGP